jgi:transposase
MTRRSHSAKALIEAERLFDEGFSHESVARQLGISKYTVRAWLDKYRQGRAIGLGRMTKHNRFTAAQKLAAVQLSLSGVQKTEVMQQFGIGTRALLTKWVAIYREQGPEGLEPKPLGRPRKDQTPVQETDAMRIQRLEMEVEILKKYNALLAAEDYAQQTKRKSSRH